MENPPPSSKELLARYHNGDTDALNELLEQHLPYVRENVSRSLGDRLRRKTDSGDIVQEAVREFLVYAPKFVIDNERAFRAILLKISMNVLRDQHDYFTAKRRDMARESPIPSTTILNLNMRRDVGDTPSQIVAREETRARVRLSLEFVDPAERDLIALRHWDGLEFAEIGKRLGISTDAARMRHRRAMARLAQAGNALKHGRLEELLDLPNDGLPSDSSNDTRIDAFEDGESGESRTSNGE